MARHTSHPEGPASSAMGDMPRPIRIPDSLLVQGAMRIIPAAPHEREITARRFLAGVRAAGHSLTHFFGIINTFAHPASVREACLAIPGPGKTAMLFVSHPAPDEEDEARATRERAACIEAVLRNLAGGPTAICQGLPEPHETWSIDAFRAAGFTHVGDLAYLERRIDPKSDPRSGQPTRAQQWPEGVSVRSIAEDLSPGTPGRDRLRRLLDATYANTLDCPELCGLRDTNDVIESHLATGTFDPAHWRMALVNDEPAGCILISRVPEAQSAELVYVGLAPSARGIGLGRALMTHAIDTLRTHGVPKLVCAVDRRNAPALGLYESLGFREFSARSAWVRPCP